MKKLLLALAVVGATLFTACNKDQNCGHEFIEYDYNKALVGTWTYLEGEQAEAMVINPDGSFEVTGVMKGGSLYEEKGTIKVVNNKVSLVFEGDTDVTEGRLELVAGKSMSIVINEEYDIRLTYDYCEKDLSDDIVGMWVCTEDVYGKDKSIAITTYNENGKAYLTGFSPDVNGFVKQEELDYKVVGNLMISSLKGGDNTPTMYFPIKFDIMPNGTELGDIMTTHDLTNGTSATFLRVKQYLDLAGQKYDYIKTFVTNVKGEDKDINFMGYTFNFAKMDGSGLDKMLKALLFAVEFPDANTLGYSYQMNGNKETYNSPIVVEGNTMTIKMSAKVATLKDVVLYAFQDADCSQMHFYMHKTAFVNFYTNMQAMLMAATDEQFDITNAEAVNAIYDNINNAVETINVSLVMSK